jgi:capsular polysaccharide transport system permease protein
MTSRFAGRKATMSNSPKDGLQVVVQPRPKPELRAVEPPELRSVQAAEPAPPSPDRPARPEAEALPDPEAPRRQSRPAEAKGAPNGAPNPRPDRRPGQAPGHAKPKRPPASKQPAPVAAPPAPAPTPEVRAAKVRPRHWMAIASFVLVVVLPLAATVGYLWTRAADQYHSEVAFSIRSDEAGSAAAGIIGAITSVGGSASDADILFEYVRSQKIVEAIDRDLDLRTLYNRPEGDPVFTLGPDATIEELVAHWRRMVDVAFESATGIINVRANAFTSEDAEAIAAAILEKSSTLVNRLSDQAQEDAIRYARDDLAEAEENLRVMRQRLAEFRRVNRLVDPTADVAGQSGLLNALQTQLAQALVERDMLLSFADESDQRVIQANRRIDAITARIEEERSTLGAPGVEAALPDVIGEYEELRVDLEFANTAYTQTLASLAAARAEARRQSRYLAPHIEPTVAESSLYPRRLLLSGLAGLFLLLGWGVIMLIYYNVRDNR